MRVFLIFLRLIGYALSLALAAYFVVRELDDPWLLGRFVPVEASEPIAEPAPIVETPPPLEPAIRLPEAPAFVFDAEATQASLEDELVRTQAALARALETRLLQNLEHLHGAYEEREEVMGDVRETVGGLVDELEREGAEAANETALAIAGIEANLAALTQSSEDLDHSLVQWADAYQSLTEIEHISSKALDERNYEFITYTVGSAETLAGIARKLAREYEVGNADLGTLIPMFNTIEMQNRDQGGRRGSIRVVANETLRIPLPKTPGELLQDQQLGERMRSQRATIVGAKRRQADVQTELGGQIIRLRRTVQRVDGLRELTRLLSSSIEDLDHADTLEIVGNEANEAQREAWDAFNEAFRQYRQSADLELQRAAKERLEEATRALFGAYISGDSSSPAAGDFFSESDGAEPGDLEWLQTFIDRYEPRPSIP